MKRAWLVLFLAVVLVCGGLAWWFFRDTPEKVIRDGFGRLIAAKTLKSAIVDVAWTDPTTRVTTGFAFAGQADTKDLTRPRALGVLGLAEGVLGQEEQTTDVVLEQDRIALRPRSVSADFRDLYERLVEDPQGKRFAVISRDPFLNRFNHGSFISHGQSVDIRANLPAFIQVVRVSGEWKKSGLPGNRIVTVPFRIDEASVKPFLISLVRTWNNDNPTPDDLAWVERTSAGLARGSFSITINRDTRAPKVIEGQWPLVDDRGAEVLRLRVRFETSGLDMPVAIGIPEEFKDVTEQTVKTKTGTSLPVSGSRTLPSSGSASGTQTGATGTTPFGGIDTTPIRLINENDTDLFHKYLEELKSKKSAY